MIEQTKTQDYTDFSALSDLRRQARHDPQATLRAVAEQFESLYLNMMLKSMRQASMGDPLFDSNNSSMYRDMYDNQIAMQMSRQKGMGLADMLVQQLSQNMPGKPVSGIPEVNTHQLNSQPMYVPVSKQPVDPTQFESHEHFVEILMPHAEQAAEELGVSPNVLIAQAALETGWGNQVQTLPGGRSSFNLFNIKADQRWQGDRLHVNTLEFHDGIARKEQAAFRVYNSYAESFRDYVEFIKSSPRYEPALRTAENPESYIRGIHEAGYATDPRYSDKVMSIMSRQEVSSPGSTFLLES